MGLLKMIQDAGEDKVFCQHLAESSPDVNIRKHGARIAFDTGKDKAQSLMIQSLGSGTYEYEALVIWIPRQ